MTQKLYQDKKLVIFGFLVVLAYSVDLVRKFSFVDLFFFPFVLAGFVVVVMYCFSPAVEYDEKFIKINKIIKSKNWKFGWEEVESVEYSDVPCWLVIKFNNHAVFKCPPTTGFYEFIRNSVKYAESANPHVKVNKRVREVIKNPPAFFV